MIGGRPHSRIICGLQLELGDFLPRLVPNTFARPPRRADSTDVFRLRLLGDK
ncbi:MAG: hypothetical protein ACI8TQ_003154 [Planctomycetota bacterium]|jgi:hypothetical protein